MFVCEHKVFDFDTMFIIPVFDRSSFSNSFNLSIIVAWHFTGNYVPEECKRVSY
jgi:hypothetical protein